MRSISLYSPKVTGYNFPGALSGVVGVCLLPFESHPFSLGMVSPFNDFKEREKKIIIIT